MLRSLRSVLAKPEAYQFWWNLVGGSAWAEELVTKYIHPDSTARILDIGCGPGTLLHYLPQSGYLGFDLSPEYIALARKRFPEAHFVCERVSKFSLAEQHGFDVVLAIGIVHHLDDAEAVQLFQIAFDALKPGGKLITVDGVYTDRQSKVARWLLSRDRGEYVRKEQEYIRLASQVFGAVVPSVRHDLLRIPYTHLILNCTRPVASSQAIAI
jgi:SAM-dependent methyltransferase